MTQDHGDAGAAEPFGGRAKRFAEACARFEHVCGVSIESEVGHLVPDGHIARIKTGEIDVIEGLRPSDLWAALISLHIDLRYVLWGK